MGRRYSLDPLADLVTGQVEQEEEELRERPELQLTPAREEALAKWAQSSWAFFTATDPDDGQTPIIRTIDQRDKKNPIKAFPTRLEYLRLIDDLLDYEQYLACEKSSQMFVSSIILLKQLHRCAFRQAWKVLLSKHKEEEASQLLDEKIRKVWLLMPDWVRVALPLTLRPKNKITWPKTGSSILGLPENAAAADARGQTYNTGLIDECCWQDELQAILTAMLPRAGQVIFWSTPAPGGEGERVFREYLKDDPIHIHPKLLEIRKRYAHVKGVTMRRNEAKNITILRIEHTADPAKRSKAWEIDAARPYPSLADFRREVKLDRTSVAGKPFFPAFAENPKRYIRRCDRLIKAPLVRGWDAGKRTPACIWGQWSKRSRRWFTIRELPGKDVDMYVFRDLVKYLSGQLSRESLRAHDMPSGANRAYEILEELALDKSYPPPPWFSGNHAFVDIGGHEFIRSGPGLTKANEPQVAAEILALGDVNIMPVYTFKKSRYEIVRSLAKVRPDGLPGILLDPACPALIRGLCGEIVYAKGTPTKPEPNEPAVVPVYSDLLEALGNALVNIVALEHAEYFATTADGELQIPDLDEEETQIVESYLTGE